MAFGDPIFDGIDAEFGSLLDLLNDREATFGERLMIWLTVIMSLTLATVVAGMLVAHTVM